MVINSFYFPEQLGLFVDWRAYLSGGLTLPSNYPPWTISDISGCYADNRVIHDQGLAALRSISTSQLISQQKLQNISHFWPDFISQLSQAAIFPRIFSRSAGNSQPQVTLVTPSPGADCDSRKQRWEGPVGWGDSQRVDAGERWSSLGDGLQPAGCTAGEVIQKSWEGEHPNRLI